MKPLATRRDRKDRGLRRLMSRTKDGRDAVRSSEAHPQARLIAPPSQGRVPAGRHSPKSAETGEAHSVPGANLRRMRCRRQALLADSCSHAQRCRQENGFFSAIDVKQTSADCDAGVAVGRRSGHCYVESFWMQHTISARLWIPTPAQLSQRGCGSTAIARRLRRWISRFRQ
jgi:hypothetical protein